jgi:beta-galactosidase
MKKISFNEGWKCYRTGEPEKAFDVIVPHDAMLLDERSETSASGVNAGWYEVQDYTYEKTFQVPREYEGHAVTFEFEGVYRKASVYINGKKAAFHDYGYTGFYVKADDFLKYGEENHIRVEAVNSDQPNCRWYSGTGIYRPVWLYVQPKEHLRLGRIRVTTLDYNTPVIKVEAQTNTKGRVKVQILDGDRELAAVTGLADSVMAEEIDLPKAELWSPENPKLYTCRAAFGDDVQEISFGIRMVECTPEKGFLLNGERVILQGACIHHDNGILGACAYDFAEERKIRILLENGYNAIRCAHNPCSKALLDACDRMGMLVMDEYTDGWYIHKNKYDYANEIMDNYKADLKDLVEKDYNHPSVIMYSIGNEVAETAQKKGIALTGSMTGCLHRLDETRPVTCGINIFFNFLSSAGFGIYSDKKAEQAAKNVKKKKAVGSEFYNTMAGIFGAESMKIGATLYPCDVKTRDAFERMDVAGYNYGIRRYRHDLKKYPNRVIVGSETFCADAYKFMEIAKENPRLIGDFVWAGMDYLGEVGIGAWEYEDYAPRFDKGCGWVSAGSGRIDLTGKPLAEMAYTRVAFGIAKIGMGVVPVNHTKDKHSPSAWKMSNALESWSWNGCEGKDAKVEVYARAAAVELYVNEQLVGKKKLTHDCKVTFHTTYHDGEIKAVALGAAGEKIAEKILKTAGEETVLTLQPEETRVNRAGGLCFVRLQYTDKEGNVKPLVRGDITVSVQNGELLAAGSACPYYPDSYLTNRTDTYFGEALAVIRPAGSGNVTVSATSPYGQAQTEIEIV